MSERYIERITENFSQFPPQPFTYNTDSKKFTLGEEQVALAEYANYVQPPTEPIAYEEALSLVDTSTLLLNIFDNHFQMPKMYEWIRSQSERGWYEARETVIEIMMDAYATLSGHSKELFHKDTFMGFGVTLYRPGHPVFNVVGNCACYGVAVDGFMFDQHYWASGFAEYEAHNIDAQTQLTALHAGAGALAAMVEA